MAVFLTVSLGGFDYFFRGFADHFGHSVFEIDPSRNHQNFIFHKSLGIFFQDRRESDYLDPSRLIFQTYEKHGPSAFGDYFFDG
jgi:hypothetical protein